MEGLNINIDIDMELEGPYIHQEVPCLFDLVYQRLTIETPKETARQKIVKYLTECLDYPVEMIHRNTPFSLFQKRARGKADLMVFGKHPDGTKRPVLYIVCIEYGKPVDESWWVEPDRLDRELLGARRIAVTNGQQVWLISYDEEDDTYYYEETFPRYDELLDHDDLYGPEEDIERLDRPSLDQIRAMQENGTLLQYGWIGEDTKPQLHLSIANLGGLLGDTFALLGRVNLGKYQIVKEGFRRVDPDWHGPNVWPGEYHYLLLDDGDSHEIVSFKIDHTQKIQDDYGMGNRSGLSVLIISIDDLDITHNSLQLNLNEHLEINHNGFTIWHDGRLTGSRGAVKRDRVRDFVRERTPEWFDASGRIILGILQDDHELTWDELQVGRLMENLFRYALLRDEFRRSVSSR